jgi:hypothetical protein
MNALVYLNSSRASQTGMLARSFALCIQGPDFRKI